MIICYGNHHLVSVNPPKTSKFSQSRKLLVSETALKWSRTRYSCSFSPQKPVWRNGFVVRAASTASSAPLGGSGAEYSDQLQGAIPNQKMKKIAGIDEEEIEDPTLLADSDSSFCEFNGVQLHHKICDAELSSSDTLNEGSTLQSPTSTKRVDFPMILLHGFGASVFSWNRVMKPLAKVIGSKVVAFDRPAFGLTSRVLNVVNHSTSDSEDSRPLNPYSMAFSVLATLYFIGFLAAEKAILVGLPPNPTFLAKIASWVLLAAARKVMPGGIPQEVEVWETNHWKIVRHSAGALVAVDSYFEAPERIAALILVAPAILAPLTQQNAIKEKQAGSDDQMGRASGSNIIGNLYSKLSSTLLKFTRFIAQAILNMVKGMGNMINSLYRRTLSAILRSAFGVMVIRMIIGKFGIPAVRSAWYDSNQVSDHIVQGYTKPLKVKGWDEALVEYTIAMLTDSASKSKPPLGKRLNEIACPVLIVTGDTDRLVPSWNAERLSRAIPGSCFELIKNCGHLPQEEKAEEFVSIVDKFLKQVFGTVEEPSLQAAT